MARYALTALVATLATLTACNGSVNGPVTVGAGQKADDVSTVNGPISIEDGATVGGAMTVNGAISLGAKATAQSAKTVNGDVTLGEASRVTGNVVTVNGPVNLQSNSDVVGKITNVNGDIRLTTAHVGGGITTINGDIDIGSGSHVDGGIHVDKPTISSDSHPRVPRVVIGPNAMVNGPLRFEHEVKLFISDSAQVSGPIEGATAEKFSGEKP